MAEVLGAVSASGHLVEAALHLGDYIKRLCEQYKGLEDYTQNIETDTMSIQTGAVAVKQSLDETPLSWQNPEDRKLDDDLDRLLTENIKNIKELHQHLKGINECNRSKLRKFGKRLQSDTKIKSLREKLRETQHRIDSHINRRMGRDLGRLRQDFYEHDNSSTESVNQLSQEVQTLAQGHDDMLSRILASQEQILEGQERLYKENAEMKKQMQGVSEQQNGIMSGLQAFATRWWSGANNDQAPALQPAAAKQIEAPPKPRVLNLPRPRTAAPARPPLVLPAPRHSLRTPAAARPAGGSTPRAVDLGSEPPAVSGSLPALRRRPQRTAPSPPRNNSNRESGRCDGPLWNKVPGRRDCTQCGFISYGREYAGSHDFVPTLPLNN